MELGASEAVKYADSILAAIQRERLPEEAERGMMRYYCFANGLVAGVALVGFTVDVYKRQVAHGDSFPPWRQGYVFVQENYIIFY